MFAPGALNIGTSGARGKGNAVSAQQLLNWTANLVCALATAGAFDPAGPFGTVAWTGGGALATLNTLLAAFIPAMATPVPVATGGAPGGNLAPIAAAQGLLSVALTNPLPILDVTGFIPGVGVPGLLY